MAGASADPSSTADERPGSVAASSRLGQHEQGGHHGAGMAALTLGALGVVFGDIGTSPLYALQTVFHADHGEVPTSPSAVYGVLSLVFWAVTIIVSIKYVTFIMRADNDGEGGIMALIALIQRAGLPSRSTQIVLISLGIFGAALFYGDGMITPAISVLSAVAGLSRRADRTGDPDLVVRDPALRHGGGGPAVRPCDGTVVRDLGDRGDRADFAASRRAARVVAELRRRVLRRARRHSVCGAGLGGAGGDGRGGALCRHGPLRPPADPPRLVLPGVSGADPQLPGARGAHRRRSQGDREPVLPLVS